MAFIDGVISPSGAGGGGGVDSYLSYGSLPGSASDGDWATTSDDGRAGRYHTSAGLWMPASLYAEAPVVLSHGGDDCAWTPASDKASLLASSWVEYSWGAATSSFSDGGSGHPELNLTGATNSGHAILWNSSYTGGGGTWTPPASGRYLAIIDWDPLVAAGTWTNTILFSMWSGRRADMSGNWGGTLGDAGWSVGATEAGAGGVPTVAGVPNFVTIDVSGSSANSSVLVPGQRTAPSVMRSDLGTTAEIQLGFFVMSPSSGPSLTARLAIRRAHVFTL